MDISLKISSWKKSQSDVKTMNKGRSLVHSDILLDESMMIDDIPAKPQHLVNWRFLIGYWNGVRNIDWRSGLCTILSRLVKGGATPDSNKAEDKLSTSYYSSL